METEEAQSANEVEMVEKTDTELNENNMTTEQEEQPIPAPLIGDTQKSRSNSAKSNKSTSEASLVNGNDQTKQKKEPEE